MECLGQALSLVPHLWECSAKHAAYIGDLEDNLTSLSSAMLRLKNLSEDVKNRVREAEEQQMKRRNQVNGWLESVEAVGKEVSLILQKGNRELEKRCPGSCRSSYKLGKEVMKMIPQVMRLTKEGQFEVVADQLPPPLVDELPMENAMVGFEAKFGEVWQSVQDKDSTVIGLVGIGGVGKTTLLKQLNNEFSKRNQGFDLVIWIVVSKPASIKRIQETIRNKLHIMDHLWDNKSEGERAVLIFNLLKKKKFIVLLDDIWERLELSEVGIPHPKRPDMSKVVIITRSREVCQSMDVHKLIEVGCLQPDQAFSLFCSKVGEGVLKSHPNIQELVKDVRNECQGLPLALVTIGRAMKGKTNAQQWKDAKRALEKYPSTFPGIEGQVFSKLVFSYDSLPTTTLQKYFEYCSLYPENHNIPIHGIIKLWFAEGLIDEYDTMYDALVQGRQIIESLIQVSLLETGQKEGTMKMHDVIRDMALWIACDRGEKKNKYWVDVVRGDCDGASTAATASVMAKWSTGVEKVSPWGSGTSVKSLSGLSFCLNLVTFIIRDTRLEELDGEIFRPMKFLKVLDLSYNPVLEELPVEIDGFNNLVYLNIMCTLTRRLPMEVKHLHKLRFLILDKETIIPRKVISGLWSLQRFEQNPAPDYTHIISERRSMEIHMLQELEGLKNIVDFPLILTSATGIQLLLDSPKLQSHTRLLHLDIAESLPEVLDLVTRTLTKHLERLTVCNCQMSVIKLGRSSLGNNLRDVTLSKCNKVRNISSLIYVPNLCTLYVGVCESMQELIGEDAKETRRCHNSNVGVSLFSRLTLLTLWYLPKLRSICPQSALPFPCLKLVRVWECRSLGKLPFDSDTAKTTPPELKIQGGKQWWDRLEWSSQATKDAFAPKLVASLSPSSYN